MSGAQPSHAEYLDRVTQFFRSEYTERGMLKWQGFFLSDHTAALKRQAREEAAGVPVMPKMEEAEVRATLNRAYASKETVRVQSTDIDPNLSLFPIVEGKVMGSNRHDSLVLDTGVAIPISHVRSVQIVPYAVQ